MVLFSRERTLEQILDDSRISQSQTMRVPVVHTRRQPVGVDAEFAYDGHEHIENASRAPRIQRRAQCILADAKAPCHMLDGTGRLAADQTLQSARDRYPLFLLHARIPHVQQRYAIAAVGGYRA
jgi:hypothetical protein